MQGQRSAIGSFPDALEFEHGSTSSAMVNSPSNQLPDYMFLNQTNQEDENVSAWTISDPSSNSGANQANQGHIEEPRTFGPSSNTCDLDDHSLSRKRKAVESNVGQSSSEAGSSNVFQRPEDGSSSCHSVAENPSSDLTIPRLGLSIGENPNPLVAHQEVDTLAVHNNDRESDGLNLPSEDALSHQDQPVLRLSALRRYIESTSTSSRNSSSREALSRNLVISGDQDELYPISDHPVLAPPSNIRTAAQTELDWSSRARPSGPSSSYSHRRLSALLRRSLLTAAGSEGDEEENGVTFPIIPPASSSSSSSSTPSQDVGTPPGHHRPPYSRSSLLLGRQFDGASGLPYLSRTMTPGSERRGRLVSEIRNALDLMHRGESMRFEDVMILDQSVFHGIADIRDRHRDMRLDIDNMSYEELLALEDHIGDVSTGLSEETISKHLKQKPYVVETGQPDAEPCCVCQEGYKDGDDLGTLECGHDFHHSCIKQWLQHKNLCPICKSTGFVSAR